MSTAETIAPSQLPKDLSADQSSRSKLDQAILKRPSSSSTPVNQSDNKDLGIGGSAFKSTGSGAAQRTLKRGAGNSEMREDAPSASQSSSSQGSPAIKRARKSTGPIRVRNESKSVEDGIISKERSSVHSNREQPQDVEMTSKSNQLSSSSASTSNPASQKDSAKQNSFDNATQSKQSSTLISQRPSASNSFPKPVTTSTNSIPKKLSTSSTSIARKSTGSTPTSSSKKPVDPNSARPAASKNLNDSMPSNQSSTTDSNKQKSGSPQSASNQVSPSFRKRTLIPVESESSKATSSSTPVPTSNNLPTPTPSNSKLTPNPTTPNPAPKLKQSQMLAQRSKPGFKGDQGTSSSSQRQNSKASSSSSHSTESKQKSKSKSTSVSVEPREPPPGPLPALWDWGRDERGRVYYINHETESTSWKDPRLDQAQAKSNTNGKKAGVGSSGKKFSSDTGISKKTSKANGDSSHISVDLTNEEDSPEPETTSISRESGKNSVQVAESSKASKKDQDQDVVSAEKSKSMDEDVGSVSKGKQKQISDEEMELNEEVQEGISAKTKSNKVKEPSINREARNSSQQEISTDSSTSNKQSSAKIARHNKSNSPKLSQEDQVQEGVDEDVEMEEVALNIGEQRTAQMSSSSDRDYSDEDSNLEPQTKGKKKQNQESSKRSSHQNQPSTSSSKTQSIRRSKSPSKKMTQPSSNTASGSRINPTTSRSIDSGVAFGSRNGTPNVLSNSLNQSNNKASPPLSISNSRNGTPSNVVVPSRAQKSQSVSTDRSLSVLQQDQQRFQSHSHSRSQSQAQGQAPTQTQHFLPAQPSITPESQARSPVAILPALPSVTPVVEAQPTSASVSNVQPSVAREQINSAPPAEKSRVSTSFSHEIGIESDADDGDDESERVAQRSKNKGKGKERETKSRSPRKDRARKSGSPTKRKELPPNAEIIDLMDSDEEMAPVVVRKEVVRERISPTFSITDKREDKERSSVIGGRRTTSGDVSDSDEEMENSKISILTIAKALSLLPPGLLKRKADVSDIGEEGRDNNNNLASRVAGPSNQVEQQKKQRGRPRKRKRTHSTSRPIRPLPPPISPREHFLRTSTFAYDYRPEGWITFTNDQADFFDERVPSGRDRWGWQLSLDSPLVGDVLVEEPLALNRSKCSNCNWYLEERDRNGNFIKLQPHLLKEIQQSGHCAIYEGQVLSTRLGEIVSGLCGESRSNPCSNPLIAKKIRDGNFLGVPLNICRTDKKSTGWALRSPWTIQKGQWIGTYTGEIVNEEEIDLRRREKRDDRYQFNLTEFDTDPKFVVDAGGIGGPLRFSNHSCNPSAAACSVFPPGKDKTRRATIQYFAIRKIEPFEPITINYRGDQRKPTPKNLASIPSSNPNKCWCGESEWCQGLVLKTGEDESQNGDDSSSKSEDGSGSNDDYEESERDGNHRNLSEDMDLEGINAGPGCAVSESEVEGEAKKNGRDQVEEDEEDSEDNFLA